MLGERAAHGQPIARFGNVKKVSVCLLDRKCPCVICLNLLKMNDLNCVENYMLMHVN